MTEAISTLRMPEIAAPAGGGLAMTISQIMSNKVLEFARTFWLQLNEQ